MAGAVAVGGWFYEQVQTRNEHIDHELASKGERIAVLETESENLEEKIDDIRAALGRVERYLLEE
jgi:hypothetical protein